MVYRYFYVNIHILTLRLLEQFVCFKDRVAHYLFTDPLFSSHFPWEISYLGHLESPKWILGTEPKLESVVTVWKNGTLKTQMSWFCDKEKLWDQQQHLKGSVNTASTEHMSKEECYHDNHTSLWCHSATPSLQTVFSSEFYALFITMTLSPGLHAPNSFAHTITDVFFKGTLSLFPTQDLSKQTVEQNRKFQKNQWSELRKLVQCVKVPAMWAQWPEFNLWNPRKGGKLEPTTKVLRPLHT